MTKAYFFYLSQTDSNPYRIDASQVAACSSGAAALDRRRR